MILIPETYLANYSVHPSTCGIVWRGKCGILSSRFFLWLQCEM